ncbi:MAG: 3'-5' exonuclease [Lentisphaeria bacterium]|nr:3'-5' exonuclease [Lentisphaeria bacterium]
MLARKDIYTVLDFETTGVVQGYLNEPWQIGAVTFKNGKILKHYMFNKLLKVGNRPFNNYAPGRHQELRSRLLRSKTLSEHWDKVHPFLLDRPLVAHNVATEKKVLRNAFPIHQFGPWIDTLKIARVAYPSLTSYKLEDLIYFLNLKPRIDEFCPDLLPHDAYFDAVASGALLEKVLSSKSWSNVTTENLISL